MTHVHLSPHRSTTDDLFEYRAVEKRKLLFVIAITAIVMIIEIVGGLLTHSLALISDAGHMFTDFFALAISFAAILCAGRSTCHHRTFGFYRMEILAALLNSLFLFGVSIFILIEGIKRIFNPEPILGLQMFIIALIGLFVNLISAVILYGAKRDDLNVKSAFLHMLADTLSSVVIVIGAVIIYFTNWIIIDSLLSIGISLVILFWGWGLFRDSANILLEAAPKGITTDKITAILRKEIKDIQEITDLHIWVITSNMNSLTAHIRLRKDTLQSSQRAILEHIKEILRKKFNINHTTIEIE